MLRDTLEKSLKTRLPKGVGLGLSSPPDASLGHLATNIAMRLSKAEKKAPLLIANELAELLKEKSPKNTIAEVRVAPPGFINIWLTPQALQKELQEISRAGKKFGRQNLGSKKKVVIDYSSVNIAKPMHVGHLRNTLLGEALASIHEELGYKVVRWNYLGDWGTQFGKLIAAYKLWGNKKEVGKNPIATLTALYIRFHEELKANPELEAKGREEFQKLESGNKENRALWLWFKNESLKEFHKTYKTLGIKFDLELGESFYEKALPKVIEALAKKNLLEKSEGSLIVDLSSKNLPVALVQKSDGASLYLTRDLANVKYRAEKYKPAKILYVVANDQALHFEQLFAITELLDWAKGVSLTHVKYGLVLAEGGQKFATREGRVISAQSILDESVDRARRVVEEKNPELTTKEKEKIARAVGFGAVRHANLREHRNSNIVFEWDKMLDMTGDSAPYVQYTHARLSSILRKAGKAKKVSLACLEEELELALILKLSELPDVVRSSGESLSPNHLTTYVYELAVLANRFYEAFPILKDSDLARRDARLFLIKTTSAVIARTLGILGIEAPEKM